MDEGERLTGIGGTGGGRKRERFIHKTLLVIIHVHVQYVFRMVVHFYIYILCTCTFL